MEGGGGGGGDDRCGYMYFLMFTVDYVSHNT